MKRTPIVPSILVTTAILLQICFQICFIESLPLAYAESEPIVSKIAVEIRNAPDDAAAIAQKAKTLIYLKEGELFSDAKFKNSVEALKQSGLFSAIDIPDTDWSTGNISLTFQLTPYRRIKDIHIKGAFPLFKREVLNQMTFYTGDVYKEEELKQQAERIEEPFVREGFIDPKVSLRAEPDPVDGNFTIFVTIDKGGFYHIRSVTMDGNTAFSNFRLKLRTQTWQASLLPGEMKRFVKKELDKDVENLVKFYRKKGYADVVIKTDVEKNAEDQSAHIRFKITEGPKYKLDFKGNDEFWTYTLKKDLTLKERGNSGDIGLRRSIRNIEKRYAEAGYLKSGVKIEEPEPESEDAVPERREIDITIDEGVQFLVDEIVIEGNETVQEKEIRQEILSRPPGWFNKGGYSVDVLEADIRAIQALYLKHGFMSPTIEDRVDWTDIADENKKRARIILTIDEGIRTLVEDVGFEGLSVLEAEAALEMIALKPGAPYREYMLKSDANTLAATISEKGYPHVTVEPIAEMNADKSAAKITYSLDEGSYTEMGDVLVTGNFRTHRRVFLRELEIKPGEPFSLTKMLEAQKNIRNIDALETAKFKAIGLKEAADKVHLLVDAEEKKPYYFEIGGGYDTYRKMYVHSKIGDHNFMGMNREAWIGAEISQIGYKADAGLTEPRLLGTKISSTTTVYAEKKEELNKDFGLKSYGATSTFARKFWKYFTAELALRYEFRELYQVDDKPIPEEDQELYDPRNILVITPSVTYNSTDSLIRPTKGLYASGAVDISRGLGDSLDNFFKYQLESRYYITPVKRLTFALRARYGYIDPFDTDSTIPDDQLFFLGGTRDVRGFAENLLRFDMARDPLGGREELLGSLELRYYLGGNLELATFYDIGAIREHEIDTDDDELRSSAGLGLRYITPIGPVGLLYGWNLDKKPGESSGKFHFSIGYTF